MEKIKMTTPLVEMDGDEMTRILWQMIKEELLLPYIDLKTEYYDLGLTYRNETNDQVTVDSANATKKYGVAAAVGRINRYYDGKGKNVKAAVAGAYRNLLAGTGRFGGLRGHFRFFREL